MVKALILGRAATVWQEARIAKGLGSFDLVIAINVAGRDYPGHIDHWVSFHPGHFKLWVPARQRAGFPDGYQLWTAIFRGKKLGVKHPFDFKYVVCNGGSSGLLAVQVALEHLGVNRAVLCGIPMENTPRFDDSRDWNEALKYQDAWKQYRPEMQGKVKSMSGWTRTVLGPPTKEWLEG